MKICQRWTLGLLLTVLVCTMRVSGQDDDLDVEDIEDTDTVEQPSPEEVKVEKVIYVQPKVKGNSFLAETFESQSELKKRWVLSEAKKDDIDENIAKYDGVWQIEEAVDSTMEGDLGLVLKSRAKHHAISTKLSKTFDFSGNPLVMQYEVKFQNGQDCGGAYVKLLTADPKLNLKRMTDKTPYTIMFGPDKCGNDNKLHFIFRHQNPVNGKFEEKHANKPSASLDSYFTDKKTHLYTLVVNPDNSFEVFVDQTLINSGNLLEDVNPPVNPPKEITDPDDRKPEDWDEREKIPDPEAVKPEDWDESEPEMMTDPDATKPEGWLDDEPELIPDPDSEMPEDWEEDMDGEWEPPMLQNPTCEAAPGCGEWVAPQIKNPLYKGKWRAAMIDNPNYKGKWKARKIPNPDFFEDTNPYKMTPIGAIGLELWSMSDDILFDNFIVTDSKAVADDWAEDSWAIKVKQEKKAGKASGRSVVDAVMDATEERPWLWAVFIIVVCLPIVLVIAYCCMPGSPKPEEIRARAKKTDEPTPDVYKEDDDESDEKEDEIEEEQAEKKTSKPKKDAPSAMSGAGDAAPAKGKAKKSDLEAEEQEEEEESAEADNEEDDGASKGTRSSPRKRKTRARKD